MVATLTFLYTDIAGSARHWERQQDEMRTAVAQHDVLLRKGIESHGGEIFRTAGDAFCAAFRAAPAAAAAAVQIQKSLYAQNWPLEAPLRVRVVLHTCEAEAYQGDYLGSGLNRIGRLLSACHGGQTLMSLATEELVRDQLPDSAWLIDLGQHRLRDLFYPEHIFQVGIPGLPEQFPPLLTLDAVPNNLPQQLTSFVGRERELEELDRLLASARLLSLTGPGGTGKTRLALQAAAEKLPEYPGGVWLVELAALTEPDTIMPAIADVLKIRETPRLSLLDELIEGLQDQSVLLLLDNCEHLIEACAKLVYTLLAACPGLKIMATSREPLGIMGETILRVPSLSIPSAEELDQQGAHASEAVRLFVERAAAVQPGFQISSHQEAVAAQICRRLDGIPLAIELAAARIGLLSLEQIAARLDDRFRLLTGGSRTALPRQQTLRALIDWSYDLLSEAEKQDFIELSVFSGGWTLEAAEAVCRGDALEGLAELVKKSLVQVEENTLQLEPRFRYLETIRQYARDRLLETATISQVRDRHLAYYLEFSRKAERQLMGPDQHTWINRLDREHENLRAAFDWALDRNPEQALEIAANLSVFWGRRGFGSEGLNRLRAAQAGVAALPEVEGPARQQRKRIQALAQIGAGSILLTQGYYAQADGLFTEAIRLAQEAQEEGYHVLALGFSGLCNQLTGNFETAYDLAQQCMQLSEQTKHALGYQLAITVIGMRTAVFSENIDEAMQMVQEAIQALTDAGNVWFAGSAIFGMGMLYLQKGNFALGHKSLQESHQIFLDMGDRHFMNITRSALADYDRLTGNYQGALLGYQETARTWLKFSNPGAVARCLECMAFLGRAQAENQRGNQGRPDLSQAVTLLGAAAGIREVQQADMMLLEAVEYQQELEILRTLAAPAEFEAAWSAGSSMDLEQAVGFASQI